MNTNCFLCIYRRINAVIRIWRNEKREEVNGKTAWERQVVTDCWKWEFQGEFSGAEGKFSAPLKGSQCREMRSTSDKTVPLSLHGTYRWEIISAFPCLCEAPACFPYRGASPWETNTKQPPGTCFDAEIYLFATWEYPQYIINSHCWNLQTDWANETHFKK